MLKPLAFCPPTFHFIQHTQHDHNPYVSLGCRPSYSYVHRWSDDDSADLRYKAFFILKISLFLNFFILKFLFSNFISQYKALENACYRYLDHAELTLELTSNFRLSSDAVVESILDVWRLYERAADILNRPTLLTSIVKYSDFLTISLSLSIVKRSHQACAGCSSSIVSSLAILTLYHSSVQGGKLLKMSRNDIHCDNEKQRRKPWLMQRFRLFAMSVYQRMSSTYGIADTQLATKLHWLVESWAISWIRPSTVSSKILVLSETREFDDNSCSPQVSSSSEPLPSPPQWFSAREHAKRDAMNRRIGKFYGGHFF